MKLIIEVDEKYYEACKDAVEEPYPSQIEEVIANGTPYNPSGDLISREDLKEAFKIEELYWGKRVIETIDNAPAVAVNCKECDGYEAGYAAGLNDAERPKGDIFPMEIVAGKCPIEVGGNCPLKPQGEWIIVKDEKYGDNVKCPFCGKELAGTDLNFCCKCGAQMKGGAE